ncbi:phosphatase PAP2 family protein [Conexibacter sp. DBS9H8]|uniref:phosphatase PAP2 family protein n=1 Tax=Conexibacter sp. DBS9H8 TaxID=2937801 RepID=UPI00273A5C16|nr:phosphatase PAP2 family protein [Conexibacter sp. DBS9H8]
MPARRPRPAELLHSPAGTLLAVWLVLLTAGWGVGRIIMAAGPRFDGPIVADLHASAHGAFTAVMRQITFFGSPVWLDTVFTVAFITLLLTRRWRWAVFLLLASPGVVLMHHLIQGWVDRPRPLGHHLTTGTGGSWPSGHATETTGLYGGLVLCGLSTRPRPAIRRLLILALLGVLVLIGVSRVVLGVHYPSDVLGGWLLGATWLAVLWRWLLSPAAGDARRWGGLTGPPHRHSARSSSLRAAPR